MDLLDVIHRRHDPQRTDLFGFFPGRLFALVSEILCNVHNQYYYFVKLFASHNDR